MKATTLAFDLFSDPEPEPNAPTAVLVEAPQPQPEAAAPPEPSSSSTYENGGSAYETPPLVHKTEAGADKTLDSEPGPVFFVDPALADPNPETDIVCPSMPDDHHVLAFVARCRSFGIEHPALVPIAVGTSLSRDGKSTVPGWRSFDRQACAQLANLILRGIYSDRPHLTPERWRDAGEHAGDWLLCERLAALEKEKGQVELADVERISAGIYRMEVAA